jgi:hypothetical protein
MEFGTKKPQIEVPCGRCLANNDSHAVDAIGLIYSKMNLFNFEN